MKKYITCFPFLSIHQMLWKEVKTFAKYMKYDFTQIEDMSKVMSLEQQDKENNELFNIIILITIFLLTIYKCILKATPLNRFIFQKYLIDQRRPEEIQVLSEDEMEFFRSRWDKLDLVP